ncbi:MAG: hydroxyacid dehydrogenase [Lentisphaeria bacterium]|nr:hydroxyacid dehydrogenase [Lentisphaeria bacterium]
MQTSPTIVFTAKPSVVRAELWSASAQARAAQLGWDVRLNECEANLSPSQWADFIADADAVITTWGAPRFDGEVLAKAEQLKIIGHAAGSVANLVSDELYARGIHVVGANVLMARSVAEWCLMMTLLAARRLTEYASLTGPDAPNTANRARVRGMAEVTIGVWGFGDVVRHLLDMLAPLQPGPILVSDPYLSPEEAERRGVRKVDLDTLCREADIVHTLTSLTEENLSGLDKRRLGMLCDGATVINAGRAPLIEREAFLAELESGRIDAVLDVHYREPVPQGDAFAALRNVVMTPHCAGLGSRAKYVECVLDEFDRFFRGQPLQHEISGARARSMTDSSLLRR